MHSKEKEATKTKPVLPEQNVNDLLANPHPLSVEYLNMGHITAETLGLKYYYPLRAQNYDTHYKCTSNLCVSLDFDCLRCEYLSFSNNVEE